jgi:hypothetical protein
MGVENKIVTPMGAVITWKGDLKPDTMVTLNGGLTVPLGSWISLSQGGALDYIREWKEQQAAAANETN